MVYRNQKRRNWKNKAAYPLIIESVFLKYIFSYFFYFLAETLTGNKNLLITLKPYIHI